MDSSDLAEEFPLVRLVLTCRTQVYNGELDSVLDKTLDIQNFTDSQIRDLLRSWAPDMRVHGKSVDQLMKALLERPALMLLARNPLMLTIIAWLYTDTTVVLPQSRTEFYRKATELLLYDWKPDTNVFQLVPKQLVLRDLALHFQDSADQRQQDRRSVDVQTVLRCIDRVLPTLNIDSKESAMPLLNEIVQRSGLLLAIDGGERYQFAHLTLQEYFAAAALRSDPQGLIRRFQHDPDAWREPVKLWCGLDEDATEFVQAVYGIDPLTAFECLADAHRIQSEAANQIIDSMKRQLLADGADVTLSKAFGSVASSLSERGKALFKWLTAQSAPQALDALSYTNLPQAAKVLAAFYTSTPAMRPMLRRLEELAVPELRDLAQAGCVPAVDDLLAIGTPGAAEALLPLLWHQSSEISVRSAFAVAALFRSPEVFDALRNARVDRPLEAPWVWHPFDDDQTPIPAIAGRLASLLESAHKLSDLPQAKLDPRIVLPVCAHLGSEVQVKATPKDARQLSIAELYQKISGDRINAQKPAAVAPVTETLEAITLALLDRLRPSPRWRFLFGCLSLPVQSELVRGISSARVPNREDWVNIFRPVSYKVKRSWHFWAIFTMVEASAIGNLVYLLAFRRPFTWISLVFSAEMLLGVLWPIAAIRVDDDEVIEGIALLGGPAFYAKVSDFLFWRSARNKSASAQLSEFGVFLLFAMALIWTPVWIVVSFLFARQWLGVPVTVALLVLLSGSVISLWFRARQLQRLSLNPLSGLRRFLRSKPEDTDRPRAIRTATTR